MPDFAIQAARLPMTTDPAPTCPPGYHTYVLKPDQAKKRFCGLGSPRCSPRVLPAYSSVALASCQPRLQGLITNNRHQQLSGQFH